MREETHGNGNENVLIPLEEEIFGENTSENDQEPETEDDESPINNRGGKASKRKTKKPARSGVSERVLEARRDFDQALEKIKSQGNRRKQRYDPTDPIDLDEMASSFRRKMDNAANRDNDSVVAGETALAKHRLLPEVLEMLNKKHMHEILLDSGVLSSIRFWMEPLPNRSLPAIYLRKSLLEALRTLPIETDHLRESGIGKVVMFFARRPKEAPEIQRLAKELVSRWSRPIIGDRGVVSDTMEMGHENRGLEAPRLQSMAFREMVGKAFDAGLSNHQKKLVMHMQKKTKSKRAL